MHLRPLTSDDIPMLLRHKVRHWQENGRDGDVVFAPSEEQPNYSEEDAKKDFGGIAKLPTQQGWTRIWILTDETEIFGEITLTHRPSLKAALHRCLLMVGIERPQRSHGWGSKLMETAIAWAKDQPTLDWITLYVFENNPRAKALYLKFGFEVVGTTKDMFRAYGQSIDDTEMVLKLR